ncbi:hypothetical protein PCASD_18185 [Puccinia coronata f. sp. avenae]|uniref:O-methyltransferase C-terminal domain-containing protein n=1 Tax=Puccinia coronata f. sp. avenae TaxID=200324 RepID=A0A2N5T2B1_9BASI|nr:hypothetical protein PCASD_18185 [Puccinia coronata f. sp. avenae]
MTLPSKSQQLANLIVEAVKDIEEDTANQIPGAATTDVNLPVVAPEDELEVTPRRRAAIRNLTGAAHQLFATLIPVGLHLQEIYYSYLQTVAIDTVVKGRIADLIHSIDPESSKGGVHVEVLAEKAGMDPRKLTHVLRFLALRNIFCEISPDHWVNNRCSLPLRTDSPNSLCNFFAHMRQAISMPGLVSFPDVLLDKEGGGAFSWDPKNSAFQKYYEPGCDFFTWLARSDNDVKMQTFSKAMVESTRATGAAAYAISTYLPEWKVVIQDLPEVIQAGKKEYQKIGSTANIEFEAVDYFEDQPAHRAEQVDAYFLRHILHDWSSNFCVQILTNLRRAAKLTTRLLICETCLEPALVDPNAPLLSNGGMATSFSHHYNLIMMSLFNAEERSQEDYREIFVLSGWKLQSVTTLETFLDRFIFEGIPDPSWKQ